MTFPNRCSYCGHVFPPLTLSSSTLARLLQVLTEGSPGRASAEVKADTGCSDADAEKWIEHFQSCANSWLLTEEDMRVIALVDNAFGSTPKPMHFTNYKHCDECKEHDDTLTSQTRVSISREHLGSMGWDPITFADAEGIAYYFPALVRFALRPAIGEREWYAVQLLWHLTYDADANKLFRGFDACQRQAVYDFLAHLAASRERELDDHLVKDQIESAFKLWKQA
ncbi:MAG: hypothetical protein HY081_05775 [Gammaproteobacteria bacterium]|nr:hypothetical protein [Gammaproteobacteria bacterium]